jgi:hypothetical protein
MTVKELKQLMAGAPDDMIVMLLVEDHLKPGMFAFTEACSCDSGISELGPEEDGTGGGEKVFLILPHGSGVSEDELEEGDQTIPELN